MQGGRDDGRFVRGCDGGRVVVGYFYVGSLGGVQNGGMMNAEIKQKWVEALRSGEYEQGQRMLRGDLGNGSKYCCLGVLCDLYAKAHGFDWKEHIRPSYTFYLLKGAVTILPSIVVDWAGLPSESPKVVDEATRCKVALTDLNDEGKSFSYIAHLIEKDEFYA